MNKNQFEYFKSMVQPGDILFISNKGFINDVIATGQSLRDKSWTNQLGHVAFVDSDLNIQESAIAKCKGKMTSGILIRPLESWLDNTDNTKWLVIMRIKDITSTQVKIMTDKGKYLQSKKLFYPIRELAGTLISELNYKFLGLLSFINKDYFKKCQKDLLLKHNPLDTDKGLYCCAFANHCSEAAGNRLIPEDIEESQCTVGDCMRNDLAYTLKFVIPKQYTDYTKEAFQSFDLNIYE